MSRKLKIPEIVSKTIITTWNNKACIEMLFTSSSELIKKNIIGTNHGAKNALACMITLDHLVSIYINPSI